MKQAVIITGAAGGIGQAFAKEYAKESSTLVLVDKNENSLQKLKNDLGQVEAFTLSIDLVQQNSTETILDFLKSNGLICRSLVHTAGLFSYQDIDKSDMNKMLLIHHLHTTQPLQLTIALLPQIEEVGEGEIIAMSSFARHTPMPGLAIYSSTKAFVGRFMEILHNEVYEKGVKVMSCEPGAIDTTLYGLPDKYRKLALLLHVSRTPEKQAKDAIRKVRKGKTHYTPGLLYSVLLPIIKILPDPLVRFIDKKISKYKK